MKSYVQKMKEVKMMENNVIYVLRKAETRTKIQLGGILIKSKISPLFEIVIGENLQDEKEGLDKAAALLGMLLEVKEQLPNSLSAPFIHACKQKGISHLRTSPNDPSFKDER